MRVCTPNYRKYIEIKPDDINMSSSGRLFDKMFIEALADYTPELTGVYTLTAVVDTTRRYAEERYYVVETPVSLCAAAVFEVRLEHEGEELFSVKMEYLPFHDCITVEEMRVVFAAKLTLALSTEITWQRAAIENAEYDLAKRRRFANQLTEVEQFHQRGKSQ